MSLKNKHQIMFKPNEQLAHMPMAIPTGKAHTPRDYIEVFGHRHGDYEERGHAQQGTRAGA